jgi:Na+/proline symporter
LIIRKIVMALVAAAAILAASGVIVVAAAFALFASTRDALGPAGAAGVVCLAAAILIALIGLIAGFQASLVGKKLRRPREGSPGILDQLFELARDRPLVSSGALIAAAALAVRNPAVLASVVKALLNQKRPAKTK